MRSKIFLNFSLFFLFVSNVFADFPAKPITVIEPFSTGGAIDSGVRLITEKVSDLLGQRLVIEPKPGAGTRLGTELIARSAKDGYTIGVMVSGSGVIIPALDPFVKYDPIKDFSLINLSFETYYLIVSNPSKGIKTLVDLISIGKSKPNSLNYATLGLGTSSHIWAELFQAQSGTRFTMVPYAGEPQGLVDVISGIVDFMFVVPSVASGHVKSGKILGLAVTGSSRMDLLSDVPTVSEGGLSGYFASSWVGFIAPAGLDEFAKNKLIDTFKIALNDPLVKSKLLNLGFTAKGLDPRGFEAQLLSDLKKVKEVGAKSNIVLGQ